MKVSERRVCRVLGQHRSTQRRVPQGRADEDRLIADMIELSPVWLLSKRHVQKFRTLQNGRPHAVQPVVLSRAELGEAVAFNRVSSCPAYFADKPLLCWANVRVMLSFSMTEGTISDV